MVHPSSFPIANDYLGCHMLDVLVGPQFFSFNKGENDIYRYFTPIFYIYGMIAPYCTFTVHSDIFINKWTSLKGLFPRDNDETLLHSTLCSLTHAFYSLLLDCMPSTKLQLAREMEERRISKAPSF